MDNEYMLNAVITASGAIITFLASIVIWNAKNQLLEIKQSFKDIVADIKGIKIDISDITQRTAILENKTEGLQAGVDMIRKDLRDHEHWKSKVEKDIFEIKTSCILP